ncbi:MAG: hypothetical protein ACRCU0_06305 [Candidatus Rhabdochlamydia sp.]
MCIGASLLLIITLISALLAPVIGSALLFEWGFSRWEQKKFSRKRCFTLLILALAVRLLIFGVKP